MRDSHFYGGEIDGLAYRGEGSEIYEGDIYDRILQGGHGPGQPSEADQNSIQKRADSLGITVEELIERERAEKKEAERIQQEKINESEYYQQFTNKSRDAIIQELIPWINTTNIPNEKTKIATEVALNYLNSNNFKEFELLEKNAKRFGLMYIIKKYFFNDNGTKKYDKYGNLVNSEGKPVNKFGEVIGNHPKLGIIIDRNGNSYGPYSGGYRKTRINKNKQIEKRKNQIKTRKKNKK